ncbi:MAG: vWA domain-containing protein, partial [Planctomycetota bacterium]
PILLISKVLLNFEQFAMFCRKAPKREPDPGDTPALAGRKERPNAIESISPTATRPLTTSTEDPIVAVAQLLDQLESTPKRPAAEKADTPQPTSPPILAEPPLVRALWLESNANDLEVLLAGGLDPDGRIRDRAIELSGSVAPGGSGTTADASILARELRDRLGAARWSQTPLAKLLPSEDGPPSEDSFDGAWKRSQARARSRLQAQPQALSIAKSLATATARGIDVVFLIDSTESMAARFPQLKSRLARLIRALQWSLPNLRIGLLFYKDEVDSASGFSADPSAEILPRLAGAEAAGGGDVPEGVLQAIEGALARGRFPWREKAAKHLIVLGDQPPKYAEKDSLEDLAKACFEQGGYRLHTLGFGAEDPRRGVPFFSDFARAGGGHTATCDSDTLSRESLHSIFGREHRSHVDTIDGVLAKHFPTR